MTTFNMTSARHAFSELAHQVIYGGKRIVIEKNGKPAFAMVPIKDVETLKALEDKIDLEAARAALKEGDFTDLEELAKELGV